MRRRLLLVLILAIGCSDALEQTSSAGQVIGFTSNANTLSLIAPIGFTVTTADLPGGFPGWAAGGGSVILVFQSGIGNDSRVDVVDLSQAVITPSGFSLPGTANGGAVQDDSIAWVALFDRAAVARVNYRTQGVTTFTVGGTPRAVAITAGHIFVINPNGGSDAPSWVSKVEPAGGSVVDSIPLTGTAPVAAVVGGDSLLYVVTAGGLQGRVSVIDPVAGVEVVVINGLSRDVGDAVYHPSGRLLIAGPGEGILEVNTLNRSLTRGPGNGVQPGGRGVTALAIDNGGRVYAGDKGCSVVHVLSGPPDYREVGSINIPGCPVAAVTGVRP